MVPNRPWLVQLGSLAQKSRRGWWLTLFCLLTVPIAGFNQAAQAATSLELRVAIEEGISQVKVGSSTKAIVRDGAGEALGEIAAMNAFMAESGKGGVVLDRWKGRQLWVEPTEGGYVFIGDRWYRGRVLVVPTEKGLAAVNYVELEQYLYSVLGGEMAGDWPQEALKAQAAAARSYALYQRQNSRNGIYDLGDTPGWQVYEGIKDESVGTQTAVNATTGQVLTYKGQIIEAVFHSSAGNCTENSEDVWLQAMPYLRSVKDFDEDSPVARWRTEPFSRTQLSALISGVGTVRSFKPEKVTRCGRIQSMLVEGDAGKRSINGETLQSVLNLKSTLFEIQLAPASDKPKAEPAFIIQGRGFGHGLGLSQYGARSLAKRGANYQEIVQHYYQNTTLAKIQVQ